MNQDQFERFLAEAGRDYNEPPDTPREEMWSQIEAERQRWEKGQSSPTFFDRLRSSHVARWSVGVAAALILGIGIGRLSLAGGAGGAGGVEPFAAARAVVTDTDRETETYRWAAVEHLGAVETFLTVFHVEARQGRVVGDPGGAARGLLSTTRLLLDSPASGDRDLQVLLQDVELVLAQIAQFSAEKQDEELDLIEDSIDQRSVLMRLQAAVSADPASRGAQGAL